VTCAAHASLGHVLKLMADNKVHHVFIVDQLTNHAQGIVTLTDICRCIAQEFLFKDEKKAKK